VIVQLPAVHVAELDLVTVSPVDVLVVVPVASLFVVVDDSVLSVDVVTVLHTTHFSYATPLTVPDAEQ
jgi:hypothetical protein